MPNRNFGIGLATAVILAVATAIVFGASIIEGPEQQRDRRFDRIRVMNLNQIGHAADCYWSLKGGLPEDLPTLRKEMEGVAQQQPLPDHCIPANTKDPETEEPYSYRRIDDTRFELCARFALASRQNDNVRTPSLHPGASREWKHEAGAQCFELTAVETKQLGVD